MCRIFMVEASKKKAGSNQSNLSNQPTNQRAELEFLKTTFRENRCSLKQIRRALKPAVRTSKQDKPTSLAVPTQQIAGQAHQEC